MKCRITWGKPPEERMEAFIPAPQRGLEAPEGVILVDVPAKLLNALQKAQNDVGMAERDIVDHLYRTDQAVPG